MKHKYVEEVKCLITFTIWWNVQILSGKIMVSKLLPGPGLGGSTATQTGGSQWRREERCNLPIKGWFFFYVQIFRILLGTSFNLTSMCECNTNKINNSELQKSNKIGSVSTRAAPIEQLVLLQAFTVGWDVKFDPQPISSEAREAKRQFSLPKPEEHWVGTVHATGSRACCCLQSKREC